MSEFGRPEDPASWPRSPDARRSVAWRDRLLRAARAALVLLGAVVAYHLAFPPFYEFAPAQPFRGDRWYFPYEGAAPPSEWLRTGLHAHAKGATTPFAAENTAEEMRARYRELKYDVYPLSNYQSMTPPSPEETIPVMAYEHGFGPTRHHHGVIGARSVSWFDFPFPQGLRHKQCVIDHLATDGAVVVVNHPCLDDAFRPAELAQLSGFDGVEIHSMFSRSVPHWDAALSAGRPVWGFCTDDSHEASSIGQRGWMHVGVRERTVEAFLGALRSGCFYGVKHAAASPRANRLVACTFEGGVLTVAAERPADAIRFLGQGGELRAETNGADRASYAVTADDTYVRAEIVNGRDTLFLNPVLRTDGGKPAAPAATVHEGPTWLARVAGLLGFGLWTAAVVLGTRRLVRAEPAAA